MKSDTHSLMGLMHRIMRERTSRQPLLDYMPDKRQAALLAARLGDAGALRQLLSWGVPVSDPDVSAAADRHGHSAVADWLRSLPRTTFDLEEKLNEIGLKREYPRYKEGTFDLPTREKEAALVAASIGDARALRRLHASSPAAVLDDAVYVAAVTAASTTGRDVHGDAVAFLESLPLSPSLRAARQGEAGLEALRARPASELTAGVLTVAVIARAPAVVAYLLSVGCPGCTEALRAAYRTEQPDMVQLLVSHGVPLSVAM